MTLLIPYRHDPLNGTELRYAIRSMLKYFTCITSVVLIGDKPAWYTGEHIPATDKPNKEYSIKCKVAMSPCETFLYSNDDFFALQPFDETLPNYYHGTCRKAAIENMDAKYKRLYKACPPDWLNFDIHAPMIMHLDLLPEPNELYPIKTAYCNLNKLPGEPMIDTKIKALKSKAEIYNLISGKMFFSTYEPFINSAMLEVLQELYPEPSKYES